MENKSTKTFSKKLRRRVRLVLLVMLIVALLGIAYRLYHYFLLRWETNAQAALAVATIAAESPPLTEEIVLPGNVSAWHESTIYARTNGYVVDWLVDIGAKVKTGDLMAVIATPEVDAQLRQTEADLKTAEANYNIAHTTADRWRNLLKSDSVSKQETEEKISAEKATAAIVTATTANRDRLLSLVSFEKVIAPFDGIVMSRTTDIGRLINAGAGMVPLFRLVQANQLRVYVRVPEYYATRMTPALVADLYFTEHPGKTYPAKLLDTAKAIDRTTRTLLIQLVIDNPDYELLAGSYTEVHLKFSANPDYVHLPVNTLIFRAKGMQVATVDGDHRVVMKPITVGRDYGDYVEVVSGLKPGEPVVVNPPDSIFDGETVKIVSTDGGDKETKKA